MFKLFVVLLITVDAVQAGYCNWGHAGTAESSVCNGQAQGGSWCNENQNNCEGGCSGKWCTNDGGSSASSGSGAHEIRFVNSCSEPVFVGILNNPNKLLVEGGGFRLSSGQTRSLSFPVEWAGRFWGRTRCDANGRNCETGACGGDGENCQGTGGAPPVTLAEITFDAACCGGIDFYDVSLVDGYNLPVDMSPIPGTFSFRSGNEFDCRTAGCESDLNDSCPAELSKHGSNGDVVACKSACEAFNTDRYCCRNNHGTPDTCPPFPYSQLFKAACPAAYSYAYDDVLSTFTCLGNGAGASGYEINFCVGGGGNPNPPPPPPPTTSSVTDCGCGNQCSGSALDRVVTDSAGSFTCRARMNWVMSELGMTEREACMFVSDEFPSICGVGCDPDSCDSTGSGPPPPTPSSVTDCGCGNQCAGSTLDRVATDSAGSFTCRARMNWVMSELGMTEREACMAVSDEFPSICGIGCDPDTCGATGSGRCGCNNCNDAIWNANAGGYSCGARIGWVVSTLGRSEVDACRLVSGEFPDICGPNCDPDRCN